MAGNDGAPGPRGPAGPRGAVGDRGPKGNEVKSAKASCMLHSGQTQIAISLPVFQSLEA